MLFVGKDLSENKRYIGKTNKQTHSVPDGLDGTVVFVIVPVFYQHSVHDGTRLLRLPSRQALRPVRDKMLVEKSLHRLYIMPQVLYILPTY
jgi:hypothetical protein